MRKTLIFILSTCVLFFIIPIRVNADDTTLESRTFRIDAMDTFINVAIEAKLEVIDSYVKTIEDMFLMYHDLSDNYNDLPNNSIYFENIYTLNLKPAGSKSQINFELYEMLEYAITLKSLTEGYFDISIGKIIHEWKVMIEDYQYEEVNKTDFDALMERVSKIEVVQEPYQLSIENGKHYIEIKENVMLDLGALAKGFATNKVHQFLKQEKVINYYINAGQSSIALGQNKTGENGFYKVALENPLNRETLGTATIKNTTITTSANTQQFFIYENRRYHHIVSPISKQPENFYHSMTMLHSNAGYADALTTAFMSMPSEKLTAFIAKYQNQEGFEVFFINEDETIDKYILESDIHFDTEGTPIEVMIMIGLGFIIVVGLGYLGWAFYKKKRSDKKHD